MDREWVEIAGVKIFTRPLSHRDEGLFIARDGLQGLDDGGGDLRGDTTDRPGQHGQLDANVFQGAGTITIDGHALAWSALKLDQLRDTIMGVAANGAREDLSFTLRGRTLSMKVRRGAKPTFRDAGIRHGRHHGRFMVTFTAANPRKYGQTRQFRAGEKTTHRGNFPALPVFEVRGPHPAYTISAGGRQYSVSSPLPAGSVDRIDMDNGWCLRDGRVLVGGVSRAQVWTVPPGKEGVVHGFSGAASALTIWVTDTFV